MVLGNDLYGLAPNSEPGTYEVPISKTRVLDGVQGLRETCTDVFRAVMTNRFVLPYFRTLRQSSTKHRRVVNDDCQAVLDEFLLRGTILQTISEELEDESICGFSGIVEHVLHGPVTPFWQGGSINLIAQRLRKNLHLHVQHIRDFINTRITQAAKDVSRDLG
ncbi:hypothetical protein MPER_02542, partial [Moniliophthora perniciosa FA553]